MSAKLKRWKNSCRHERRDEVRKFAVSIQLWENLPQGEEKDELLRDIVAERREKE